jgi:hypothetical protein
MVLVFSFYPACQQNASVVRCVSVLRKREASYGKYIWCGCSFFLCSWINYSVVFTAQGFRWELTFSPVVHTSFVISRQEGVFIAVSKIVVLNNSCSDSTFRNGEYFNDVQVIQGATQKFLDNCYKTQTTSYMDIIYSYSSKYIPRWSIHLFARSGHFLMGSRKAVC